ncbi:MAG: hypothetical protein ACYSUT_00980 [Planctomycetota bacterium]
MIMSIIAILVAVAIVCVPSFYGLVIYFATLIFLPGSLSLELGPLNFPVHRIAILMLFLNLFMAQRDIKTFRFIRADVWLLIFFAAQIAAGLCTTESMMILENRAGYFMDVALPYFAVRVIINKKEKYLLFLRYALILSAFLVVPALYQMTYGTNPLLFGREPLLMFRRGFWRAYTSFDNSIYFGLFYAVIAAAGTGLILYDKKLNRIGSTMLVGSALVGMMTSMSSGPLMAAVISGGIISLFPIRRRWKMIILSMVIGCVGIEFLSNRHFYEVVDRFTFQNQTAWYRARLIEVALFEGGMTGHWFVGYGLNVDPGWGERIVGPGYWSDIVNQYLLYLCRFGLIGLFPFLVFIWCTIRRLFRRYFKIRDWSDQWLIWCLAAAVIGTLISLNTVSIFGAVLSVFFMLLAMANNLPSLIFAGQPRVKVKRVVKVKKKAGGRT